MKSLSDNISIDYTRITEVPGLKATQEQIERLYQRYHFARLFAEDKDVLEVACGSGIGLGYLAKVAKKVVGGDIEKKNVLLAKEQYRSEFRILESGVKEKIGIDLMDAHNLNIPDKSFDLVLLYETIYYLKEPEKFISRAERILRKNGKLIICSVNKDWEDFHPSPYTHKYFSLLELYQILKDKFRKVEMYGGFPVNGSGLKNKTVSHIKRLAVTLNLIPGSLKARTFLKRIFMGKLSPLPEEVYEDMAPYESPMRISVDKITSDFKIIYAIARK